MVWRLALALLLAVRVVSAQDDAPQRLNSGRFTAVYYPVDDLLARSLLKSAVANDTFPWLPRPQQRVLVAIAPDAARFRAWAGPGAPEWGAALAFPDSRRVIMQGRGGRGDAGNPIEVLRHELAHLVLHEFLGDRPPRWFDEGYASLAAREWRREDVLSANVALALRGTPSFDELDAAFRGGASTAQSAYALSYRAVSDLASLDRARGLTLFFQYWSGGRSMDMSARQAFGVTLPGFEKQFQQRTRRRYGGLALLTDFSVAMLVLSFLLAPFVWSRRARDRKRLQAMVAADEAAERTERESAIALLLGESTEESPPR